MLTKERKKKGKRKRKKEKGKENVPNLMIAFGLPIETFRSNKLASRVVSKVILIVLAL